MSNSHALKRLLTSNLCERIGIISSELGAAYVVATRDGTVRNYAEVGELYIARCELEQQLGQVFTPSDPPGKDVLLELLIEKEEMMQTEHDNKELVIALLKEKSANLQKEYNELLVDGKLDPKKTSLLMKTIAEQQNKIRNHFKSLMTSTNAEKLFIGFGDAGSSSATMNSLN